jgi:hypothetical protein
MSGRGSSSFDALPEECLDRVMTLVAEAGTEHALAARGVCAAWRDAVTRRALRRYHAAFALPRLPALLAGRRLGDSGSSVVIFDEHVIAELEHVGPEDEDGVRRPELAGALSELFGRDKPGPPAGPGRSRFRLAAVDVLDGGLSGARREPRPGLLAALRGQPARLRLPCRSGAGPLEDNADALMALTELSFSFSYMCGADMRHVARMTALQSLNMFNNDIGYEGVEHLVRGLSGGRSGPSSLRLLRAGNCRLDDKALALICGGLTELRELDVGYNNIGDAGLLHLSALTRLETLGVALLCGGPRSTEALEACPRLRRLDASFAWNGSDRPPTAADWGPSRPRLVPALAGLIRLDISNSNIDDAALAPVAALRQLCVLDASVNRITSRGVELLRGLRQLVRLDLGLNRVCDAGAAVIAADLLLLEVLEIGSNRLSGAGVAALRRLPALRRLDARDQAQP